MDEATALATYGEAHRILDIDELTSKIFDDIQHGAAFLSNE
jgi:hypothetical protein